jgi:hypothetical protein
MVDTGTSFLLIPATDYMKFKTRVQELPGMDCNSLRICQSVQPCSFYLNKLDPITLRLDDADYTIPPAGYLLDIPMDVSFYYRCRVPISFIPDSMRMGLLGDTFLRNFYSSYDFSTESVSFGVNAANPWKSTIVKHGQPTKKNVESHKT